MRIGKEERLPSLLKIGFNFYEWFLEITLYWSCANCQHTNLCYQIVYFFGNQLYPIKGEKMKYVDISRQLRRDLNMGDNLRKLRKRYRLSMKR